MGITEREIAFIVSISLIVITFIFLIVTVILWKKVNRMQRKYDAMIGHAGVANLEDIITELQRTVSANQTVNSEHDQLISQMKDKLSALKGNVAMLRYNAFSELGSDQSFSVAFLDDHSDGLVFSVIYGREESYSYGKPIFKGESKYPLSPEEIQVVSLARSKSQHLVGTTKSDKH